MMARGEMHVGIFVEKLRNRDLILGPCRIFIGHFRRIGSGIARLGLLLGIALREWTSF